MKKMKSAFRWLVSFLLVLNIGLMPIELMANDEVVADDTPTEEVSDENSASDIELESLGLDVSEDENSLDESIAEEDTISVASSSVINKIYLNRSVIAMHDGDTASLSVSYLPSDTTADKTISWKSSNATVATVDSNGNIQALSTGTTTIIAYTTENKTAECYVVVNKEELYALYNPSDDSYYYVEREADKYFLVNYDGYIDKGLGYDAPLTSISIDSSLSMNVGATKRLDVTYDPSETTDDKIIIWTSSNESVATVNNNGLVEALAVGETTITARSAANSNLVSICKLTVENPIRHVILNKTFASLIIGETVSLSASFDPVDAVGDKTINWSTTNANVATVDSNGNVKTIAKGTADIIATASNGKTAKCRVVVVEDPKNTTVETEPMYRFYNPNSGEHFYTSSVSEGDTLWYAGWYYEGIGWYAPVSSKTPVYRLYNANAGDHHYTTSLSEKNNLVKVGWKYEGIGWYSDDDKTVPLYRQYNPNAVTGTHNYTTSKNESDYLVSVGWRYEGISWYGANNPNSTSQQQTSTQLVTGVKYSYDFYAINNVIYSGMTTPIFLKTDNMSVPKGFTSAYENNDRSFDIVFLDKDGNEYEVSNGYYGSYVDVDYSQSYFENNGSIYSAYRFDSGWFLRYKFENPGTYTVAISETYYEDYWGNKNFYDYETIDTITVLDYTAELNNWIDDIISKVKTDGMSLEEEMRAISRYLAANTRYSDCAYDEYGNRSYVSLLTNAGLPNYVSMIFNSYTSPAMLTYIGDYIGYPLHNMYGDYEIGTLKWQIYHYQTYHENDDGTRVYFYFCPDSSTGLIEDITKVEKYDFSKF